jgi:hypothetical protein
MAKIRAALGPRCALYDLAAVMERLADAARNPLPVGPVKVVIVTQDMLRSRRMSLMSKRFTTERDGIRTLKPGIVHYDAPGDPIKELSGLPSPPERFPQIRRGPIAGEENVYTALLIAVVYHKVTGKSPTKERKRFFEFAEVVFREVFRRTAPWSALRKACERWERSRGFSKRDMQERLFGGR